MKTNWILSLSALFLAGCGIILSFLPQEILTAYLNKTEPFLVMPLQIMGALYLSLAIINWMNRANLIGGIYNRPLALGNAMHFAIGAITLLKFTLRNSYSTGLLILTVLYVMFAIAFFKIIFTTPKQVSKS